MDFKNELKSLGYEIPSLSEMCLFFGGELSKRNVPIDDKIITAICEKIRIQEDQISIGSASFFPNFSHQNFKTLQVRNQKNKEEKKELEVSDDFAIGFIKAFGGALLCVIPHPIAWGAGVYFMTKGVDEMIDSVKSSRSENIEERMRQLPPPPDRHKYK